MRHEATVSTLQPKGPPLDESRLRRARHSAALLIDPIGTVRKRFERYGDVYRVPFADNALYVVRHPDHIRDVLVTHGAAFGKGHASFARLRQVLGDGLLTSEGEDWRRQRRLVQPAFSRPRLAEYSEVMVEEALATTRALCTRGDEAFSLSREMTSLTLRIVARTLFGQRVDDSPRVGRAMLLLNRAFGRPDLLPAGIPTPSRLRLRRALTELDAAVHDVIARREAELAAGRDHTDLLQRLLDTRDEADGSRLSRQEIRDQLLTLYLAGHETTSHALGWTFYLLASDARVRHKLQDELARVLAGRPPSFEDLSSLPYTEQVFKEAMRLYPPVTAIPRRASEDSAIGPYRVPAGSDVVIWLYHTHRDARWYPEPERCRPERFDEAESAARHKHAYLPFGAGQRACIGQMFALIEGQLILATLAQQLDLRYAARRPPGLRLGVTLAPKNGLPMRALRRGAPFGT